MLVGGGRWFSMVITGGAWLSLLVAGDGSQRLWVSVVAVNYGQWWWFVVVVVSG